MLNSFWGKFGQRSNMPQIKYVSEPAGRFDNALGKKLMESIILTGSGYFDMHVLGTIGYNSWCHTVLVQIL